GGGEDVAGDRVSSGSGGGADGARGAPPGVPLAVVAGSIVVRRLVGCSPEGLPGAVSPRGAGVAPSAAGRAAVSPAPAVSVAVSVAWARGASAGGAGRGSGSWSAKSS